MHFLKKHLPVVYFLDMDLEFTSMLSNKLFESTDTCILPEFFFFVVNS